MFIKKALPALALLACCACGSKIPQKTNVLSKPPSQQKKSTTKPVTDKPEQTVFTKPEQKTRDNKTNDKPEPTNVEAERPQITYTPPASFNALPEMEYGSRSFYLNKVDSLQKAYSVSDYNKNIQTIINQITEIPGKKKNPAVTADSWYAAIDFNIRKPHFVVLHHTAQTSAEQTLFTFSLRRPGRESSSHYVVGRDGSVYQMLNDYVRSYHAGLGKWGSITDMNSCSIGIEIDNNGSEPFSDEQIKALLKLLEVLKNKYGIPQANFIGHSDVAPGRKSDPSKYFPWKRLADAGFGYWYDSYNLPTPPADFNAIMALRAIGYDTRDVSKAIGAFKLHYIQNDLSPTLTDYDKKVLYSIYRKY